jgi:GntR family transcriptional repressor for pyruvate dehydrogenase complex
MEPIKKVTVVNQVVNKLVEYIKEESLEYGAKLPTEYALCQQLDVARSSLREAYRILQAQGVITIKPGRGAFVSHPLMNETATFRGQWFSQHKVKYDDLLEIREALETLAVHNAAQRITKEGIEALQKNLDEFKLLMNDTASNYKRLAELDEQFHHILIVEARNQILVEINRHIEEELLTFRYAMMKIENRVNNTYDPHKKILEALMVHDQEASVVAMKKHLKTAREDMDMMARGQ